MRLAHFALCLGALACTDDSNGIINIPLSDVVISESALVPNVLHVTWSTTPSQSSFVEFGLNGALDQVTPLADSTTDHSISVIGLKAGETYAMRPVTVLGDGTRIQGQVQQVDIPSPAFGLPALDILVDTGDHDGGYMLTTISSERGSYVTILDRQADVVWFHQIANGHIVGQARLGLDGQSIFWNDVNEDEDVSQIHRVALDGSWSIDTYSALGHLDFVERDNREFAWVGYDYQRRMVDGSLMDVATDVLFEGPEGKIDDSDTVQLFGFMDDHGTPWWTGRQTMSNISTPDLMARGHINSLAMAAEGDDYLLMSSYLNALIKIERSTGEVVWQMGGPDNEFDLISGDLWHQGYISQAWDNRLLVLDSGEPLDATTSASVVEYAFHGPTRTMQEMWRYEDPDGRASTGPADAHRLDNGHTLMSISSFGEITEVDTDGEIVWQVVAPSDRDLSRVQWLDSLYDVEQYE
jgi:hypothetical protein